ncbi:alpha/beta hydrolase [Jeotgalibacillus sp. ET6]|uniref:alpha/beta family hydrolase n=1 Tax=Jeotgalibacillus sp. ET6 TaxID=3037260 RepID=UPI0024186812|nr:alpha/beta family hydrolase [Jeotgalibacillus sp. ET6]MDG5473484.1 alpha/beta hydrolase [Jeotgalibacillus sp. ET6]
MEITRHETKGYKELLVPYTLFKQEQPKGLVIVLPGLGYTAQAPLLHYTTGIYINRGFDVLQVNYRYSSPDYDHFDQSELIKALNFDIHTVINTLLENESYEDYYLIGKSLGTIAVSSLLKMETFSQAKTVWMTPLLHKDDVRAAMLNHHAEGLCFIGSEDPYYQEERFNQLKHNAALSSFCFPEADHSLELKKDTQGSIKILSDIMDQINSF